MAGQYSTRSFFRQMPNAMLERYFNEQGCVCGGALGLGKGENANYLLWGGIDVKV